MNGINMKSKENIRKKIILNDQYMYLSNEKSLVLGASIILIEKNDTIAVIKYSIYKYNNEIVINYSRILFREKVDY